MKVVKMQKYSFNQTGFPHYLTVGKAELHSSGHCGKPETEKLIFKETQVSLCKQNISRSGTGMLSWALEGLESSEAAAH